MVTVFGNNTTKPQGISVSSVACRKCTRSYHSVPILVRSKKNRMVFVVFEAILFSRNIFENFNWGRGEKFKPQPNVMGHPSLWTSSSTLLDGQQGVKSPPLDKVTVYKVRTSYDLSLNKEFSMVSIHFISNLR